MKKDGPAKLVKSAIRTLSLFEVFAEVGRPLSLADIAERMDAPKSSCHELIQTLIHLRYITVLDGGKLYYPSRRLSDLVDRINRFNPVKELIESELKALRDLTGETIIIGRLHGHHVLYSEVFEGTHTIRYSARAGDLKPLHASALGKALLARLDPAERELLLAQLDFERFTPHTLEGVSALQANLDSGDASGVYTTAGEHLGDVMAIACPIEVRGHLLAVGLAGPSPRMEQQLDRYVKALKTAVGNIHD